MMRLVFCVIYRINTKIKSPIIRFLSCYTWIFFSLWLNHSSFTEWIFLIVDLHEKERIERSNKENKRLQIKTKNTIKLEHTICQQNCVKLHMNTVHRWCTSCWRWLRFMYIYWEINAYLHPENHVMREKTQIGVCLQSYHGQFVK